MNVPKQGTGKCRAQMSRIGPNVATFGEIFYFTGPVQIFYFTGLLLLLRAAVLLLPSPSPEPEPFPALCDADMAKRSEHVA